MRNGVVYRSADDVLALEDTRGGQLCRARGIAEQRAASTP